MKTKSLFISTIAMVVMLVVALSVGTFAWYASQDSVNATGATVNSVQSDDSAIGLGWGEGSNATANSVVLGNAEIRPMIPTEQPSSSTGGSIAFNEALLKSTPEGTYVIGSFASGSDPWRANNRNTPAQTELYIQNLNANDVTVTTTVSINAHVNDKDLNDLLRVAIYVGDEYIGTWGGGNAYAHTFVADDIDKEPGDIQTPENLITMIGSGSSGATFTLGPNANKRVYILAWLEGTLLNTGNMHLADAENMEDLAETGFSVNFGAAQTTSP